VTLLSEFSQVDVVQGFKVGGVWSLGRFSVNGYDAAVGSKAAKSERAPQPHHDSCRVLSHAISKPG
jgi:hypothetical protein